MNAPKPIIGKGGRFLWTRGQVEKILAERQDQADAIFAQQHAQLEQLEAELKEARNVVRSVVRNVGQLDSVLSNWLESKEPKDEPAPDASSGEPALEVHDEVGEYPHDAADGDAPPGGWRGIFLDARVMGPEDPRFDHLASDRTTARVLVNASEDCALTFELDGGARQVLHRPKEPGAEAMLTIWKMAERSRHLTIYAERGEHRETRHLEIPVGVAL